MNGLGRQPQGHPSPEHLGIQAQRPRLLSEYTPPPTDSETIPMSSAVLSAMTMPSLGHDQWSGKIWGSFAAD